MNKYLKSITNAQDEVDYNFKKNHLKTIINEGLQMILNVKSVEDFYSFCINFIEKNPFSAPIYIEGSILEENLDHFAKLERLNYPNDFLQWHKNYGNIPFRLGFVRINPTKTVLESLKYDNLLTAHNFINITRDGGGNAYVYDLNGNQPQIKRVNHATCYSHSDILDELYSEYYDFWYDEDTEEYHNPQKLDITDIYDKENEFSINSVYIKQYLLKDEESIEIININTFLEFLILKAKEALQEILEDIENDQ